MKTEEIMEKFKEKQCPVSLEFDKKEIYLMKIPGNDKNCANILKEIYDNLGPHHKKLFKKHTEII